LGGIELREAYSPPSRETRECKYWWFDAWDGVVNSVLAMLGSPHISVGQGEIAIDPHIHTLFSHCSISQPQRVIRKAVKLGLGGIAVMDHNDIRGALDTMRCAEDMKGRGEIPEEFLVIPGLEINSTVGHVGALFVEEDIPMSLEPAELVRAIHDAGGLAVAVHPYHSTGIKDTVFDAPFDAVEIESGSVFGTRLVEQNRALMSDPRMANAAKLGSSDAHYARAMASCFTIVQNLEKVTLSTVREAIMSGDCRPETSTPYRRLQGMLGSVGKLK